MTDTDGAGHQGAILRTSPEPIAIVGMSCRFAGEVNSPEEFWQFLTTGRTAVGDLPADRWTEYETAGAETRRVLAGATRRGSFRADIKGFDAAFFGITPREAELMDPQQRMILELSWEALEHAGIPPHTLAGTDAGVYVGVGADDYGRLMLEDLPGIEARSGIGGAFCAVANRVSYTLDLRGPSLAVDTACSSSLVALHNACQALRLGEIPLALVGGVLLVAAPGLTLVLDAAGATSPDGSSKSFDAAADGYGRGEGGGVLVLKRLADAQRDGDRVLALIRGSAVHQDGRTEGIMAPSEEAQRHLLRQTYALNGIAPGSVDYVEAHGTGTRVGDPIEAGAMISVFGPGREPGRPCLIGSVKANIGHLEAGAGVAGVIKTVLSLTRAQLPPSVNLTTPNPAVPWEGSGVELVTGPRPWPAGERPRRAGVSGYGYGGTLAHVILEEAPAGTEAVYPGAVALSGSAEQPTTTLLPLSARSSSGLAAAAARLAQWLRQDGAAVPLAAVGHTLAQRRSHLTHRAVVAGASREELAARLQDLAAGTATDGVVTGTAGPATAQPPVWIFSGHGSQWAGMGQILLRTEPVFGKVLDELHDTFSTELGVSPREALQAGELGGVDTIQPLIFAVQVALAEVWRSYGVEPAAVIGHSVGEIAANVTAGSLTLEEGARLVCRRSRLLRRVAGAGAMAMVGLPFTEAEARLGERPDLAAAICASPGSSVVAGTPAAIEALAADWQAEGIMVRRVDSDVAFHSPQMDPLLDELQAAAAELRPRPPRIPVYSTALTDPRSGALRDGAYWAANLRNPVRLTAAVDAALADGHRLFTEISAHPVVVHSVNETVAAAEVRGCAVTATLRRGRPEQQVLLENLAAVHCAGARVDWRALQPLGELADVPAMAWQHVPYWLDAPRRSGDAVVPHDPRTHNLLGGQSIVAADTEIELWHTTLDEESRPYPGRHPVRGVEIVPAAVLLNTFLTAGHGDPTVGGPHVLTDVGLRTPVPVSGPSELQVLRQAGTVRLSSRPSRGPEGGPGRFWLTHTTARFPVGEPSVVTRRDPQQLRTAHPQELAAGFPIDRLAELGVAAMGFPWTVERLSGGEGSLLAEVTVAPDPDTAGSWAALLDAALSIASVVFPGDPVLRMPADIRRVAVAGSPPGTALISTRTAPGPAGADTVDVEVLDPDGTVLAQLTGLRYGRLDGDPGAASNPRRLVHQLSWRPAAPVPAGTEVDGVAVLGDPQLAADLAAAWLPAGVRVLPVAKFDELECVLDELGAGAAVLVSPALPADGRPDPASAAWLLTAAAGRLASWTGYTPPPRLWALTRGVREARGATALHHAPLWGLGRVFATEYTEEFAGVLDLPAEQPCSVATELLTALRGRRDENILSLRPAGAEVARLALVEGPGGDSLRCRPDGTYLVTGGHGVLGLRTAEWLVGRGARRILLAGRRALPQRGSWLSVTDPAQQERIEAVRRMEEGGATVWSIGLDIADPAEARRLLDVEALGLPPIRGVVHAAGLVESRLARDTNEESLRRVMRPKADGALVLHELFPPGSLDFLAFFSSAGHLFGLPGQTSYAAGNSFLDTLAGHRRAEGHQDTISLAWTSWRGLGMSTSSEVIDAELAARGTGDITAAEAFGAWDVAAGHGLAHVAVFRTLPPAPGVVRPQLLAELSASEPNAPAAEVGEQAQPWVQLDPDERLAYFVDQVREQAAQEMRLPVDLLDTERPLVELGLDSIMTVAIRLRLQKQLGVVLPSTLLWKHPTVRAIGGHLVELTATAGAPEPEDQPPSAVPAELRPVVVMA
ncbi:6-methylsalicylic acid synthase [Kitasatospora sp. MMS16-BH015]|uniref:type I polyketide synthase n=1 Tax=Kitasatospora sp. MMS16-BH015 TaxID=2018025 RepID=UPI000CA1A661|nr:type I polyketide synthase [Kitasatospora sp. MMS16-BH015]AUG76137.1 6-methylsalicylic acid synthase [Kitasatospora sp. MMS16-BH015]